MSEIIKAEVEVKINSEFVDTVEMNESEENQLIMQQFEDDSEFVYIVLNGAQIKVSTYNLMNTVKMFYNKEYDKLPY